ncbi:MAG TPA: hypothetical protein ENK85_00455 [Saprospiraceae bacterium]|nr:hypothetical protein [Saprospiraceae bacterium]
MLLVGFVLVTLFSYGSVSYLEPLQGEVSENGNHIQWTMESVKDVNFFIVQRSQDGVHFFPLAMVAKEDNVTEYTFVDEKVKSQNWFYRVVDVDYQGVGEFTGALYLEYAFLSADVKTTKPPTNITINDHIAQEMNSWLTELEFPTISKLGMVANFTNFPVEQKPACQK